MPMPLSIDDALPQPQRQAAAHGVAEMLLILAGVFSSSAGDPAAARQRIALSVPREALLESVVVRGRSVSRIGRHAARFDLAVRLDHEMAVAAGDGMDWPSGRVDHAGLGLAAAELARRADALGVGTFGRAVRHAQCTGASGGRMGRWRSGSQVLCVRICAAGTARIGRRTLEPAMAAAGGGHGVSSVGGWVERRRVRGNLAARLPAPGFRSRR